MKHERMLQFNASELIAKIDEADVGGAPGLLRDLATTISEQLTGELDRLMARITHLKEQRASLHPGETVEDARRRLQNPKLVTSHPADRARALLVRRLELTDEIADLFRQLFIPLVKLEQVDAELEALRGTLAELEAVRELHRSTGVYSGGANFLSRLHENYKVDWRDLECLSAEDDREIADVILRRYRVARQQQP